MAQWSLRSLFICQSQPALQFWFCRVRAEFADQVRGALRGEMFNRPPTFIGKFSDLYAANLDSPAPLLVKRIRAQKEADYVRRYFRCQGKREFFGSARLLDIRINCPEPIGYAVNLLPWSRADSLFICRFLPHAIKSTQWMRQGPPTREWVMNAVARDMRRMLENNLFHRDVHTENLLVLPAADPADAALYWIDNDIRPFGRTKRPLKREQFLKRWFEVGYLTPEERAQFAAELPEQPAGV